MLLLIHRVQHAVAEAILTLISKDIFDAIYQTIDEVNRQLPSGARLVKSEQTVLMGEGGVLDSLGLITLLVGIEEALQSKFGIQIALLEEDVLANSNGPYHTIGSLVNWIVTTTG